MTIVRPSRAHPSHLFTLGGLRELSRTDAPCVHFNPGDGEKLACNFTRLECKPSQLTAMGRAAREEYPSNYTAERNLQLLMEI